LTIAIAFSEEKTMEELSYEVRELTDTELDEVAGGTGDGNALINVERNFIFVPITAVVLL
jgi:hypothetical protein